MHKRKREREEDNLVDAPGAAGLMFSLNGFSFETFVSNQDAERRLGAEHKGFDPPSPFEAPLMMAVAHTDADTHDKCYDVY